MKHIVLALLTALALATAAHAQAPRTIRYDGRLEQNGRPADGSYDLGFALFDAAQAGNQLWPGAAGTFATVRVTVSNGQFVVELGGQGMEALGWQVFAAPRVFVQTQVNGTALNGRRAIGAVPFAVRADNGVPAGTIVAFGGGTLPDGWLWCDGSAYPIDGQYALLAAALGDAWGRNANQFNVPDLRGRFLRAVNDMGGPAGAAGNDGTRDVDVRAAGSFQGDGFGSHRHNIDDHTHIVDVGGRTTDDGNHDHDLPDANDEIDDFAFGDNNSDTFAANGPRAGGRQIRTLFNGVHGHNWGGQFRTDGSSQGAAPTSVIGIAETRPRNVAVKYIIKY
jgi:hypothetical protein